MNKSSFQKRLVLIFLAILFTSAFAQSSVEVNANADFVSRYIWRGIDFGKSPAIQPSIGVAYKGFAIGAWGSYTLNETASGSDEIDMCISYTADFEPVSFTAMVTDYYFPNNGVKIGNYNNYDDEDGAGAHTLEAGISASFKNFPLNISGYFNFYNDEGNNSYFQVDVPFTVKNYDMSVFVGATPGSEDTPDYYGAEDFSVINLGVSASKEIKITDSFSIPAFVSYILNPKAEISHVVFGISL